MATEKPASFGELLRCYRTAATLSQEALAEASGLSLRGISDLERGVRTVPRLETVRLLADALGLGPDERSALLAARDAVTSSTSGSDPGGPGIHSSPLPTLSTPLIGRVEERRHVGAFLTEGVSRLVTLTGPGGVGKTTLALAVGQTLTGAFPDGVWFVPLATVADPDLVLPTVIQVLGHSDHRCRLPRRTIRPVTHREACACGARQS